MRIRQMNSREMAVLYLAVEEIYLPELNSVETELAERKVFEICVAQIDDRIGVLSSPSIKFLGDACA
jgi:hypothetical protein